MRAPIGRPAYQEVADDLRAQITDGRLSIGDAIPSTAQLCKHYSVSATVVRTAIAQLQAEGTLRGQPGKAVYVTAKPIARDAATPTLQHLGSEFEDLREALAALSEQGVATADHFRSDLAELRRQVGRMQAQLIDLYSKTGHQFPRERRADVHTDKRPNSGAV